jgi:hypothetical protein
MDERTEARLIFQAVHGLKVDVPVMRAEITNELVTLYLYGGQVKTWPICTSAAPGGVVQPEAPAPAGIAGNGGGISPKAAARARGRAGASSPAVVTPGGSGRAKKSDRPPSTSAKKSDRIRKGRQSTAEAT